MPFQAGETVGQYQIIEQLGQGGMATVYKAYHAALDRDVAIKVLHPAFTEDPNFLARFQREARVVAKLDHPNIVPIYDFSQHENQPYLVMKFIKGETLKARLSRRKMTLEEALPILEKVGVALQYAHKKGIVHRDVKPSNVLLSEDGETYLTDFGLARIAQSGSSTLTSDQMVGTPQYISPEQAMSKSDLDFRTDIYSFGVMIYEIAVGRVPYNADTPYAVIHDHIYTPLPLPRNVNPNVPEEIERFLLKALAKNPVDRFVDINSMMKAFRSGIQASTASEIVANVSKPPPLPVKHEEQDASTFGDFAGKTRLETATEKSEGAVLKPIVSSVGTKKVVPVADHITPPPIPAAHPKKRDTSVFWLLGCLGIVIIGCAILAIIFIPKIIHAVQTTITFNSTEKQDTLFGLMFPRAEAAAQSERDAFLGLVRGGQYTQAEQRLITLWGASITDRGFNEKLVHALLYFSTYEENGKAFLASIRPDTVLPVEVAKLRVEFRAASGEGQAIAIEEQNVRFLDTPGYFEAYFLEIEIMRTASDKGWDELNMICRQRFTDIVIPGEYKTTIEQYLTPVP